MRTRHYHVVRVWPLVLGLWVNVAIYKWGVAAPDVWRGPYRAAVLVLAALVWCLRAED